MGVITKQFFVFFFKLARLMLTAYTSITHRLFDLKSTLVSILFFSIYYSVKFTILTLSKKASIAHLLPLIINYTFIVCCPLY